MSKHAETLPKFDIALLIRGIRDCRVILDSDLARVYGVPTFRLNEAVKRNRNGSRRTSCSSSQLPSGTL